MFKDRRKPCAILLFVILILFDILQDVEPRAKTPGMYYILQWTRINREPYAYWKPGQKYFKALQCEYQNCFITNQVDYLDEVTDFDVILFNVLDIGVDIGDISLPNVRADNQIYVFVTTDSARNYPVRGYNWFFNYTWTYKLNSDIPFPYITVRNKSSGEVIGPKRNMHWMDIKDMEPTEHSVIEKLQTKRIAAAWFASNCQANSGRSIYISNLREALSDNNHVLNIYGQCGDLDCNREEPDRCLLHVEKDYFFYLAFENSFSEDYVTEKLLTALEYYAVPVVFGSANYSRFMPNGIYINAYNWDEESLAKKMSEILRNESKYYDFFKWHRYYSFHNSWESGETDPVCAFCAFLNGNWSKERRVYARFSEWWNETGHKVPQTEEKDTIFYFDKPDENQAPYLSYWSPAPKEKSTLLQDIGSFIASIFSS